MKNIYFEVKRITAHYFHSNVGLKVPHEAINDYVMEGILEWNTKKHGMKKGNRKR